MSNHYHLVLRVEPRVAVGLSDEEVAERGLRIHTDQQSLELARERLGSLSWFMRYSPHRKASGRLLGERTRGTSRDQS